MVQRYSTYGCDWECETYEDCRGELVKYDDYAALKELTDKLVKLRRGGCMSFSEQKALDDLLKEYKV